MDLRELLRTTTEPLTAPTLRQILEAQQTKEASEAQILTPLNLLK